MEHENGTESDGPPREITVNQAVAWNLAWLRRAAGLTQDQLGERIGWTGGQVSEAERSWNGERVRKFDAQALAVIAIALRVPVMALFLPPGEGEGALFFPDGTGVKREARELAYLALPDNDEETPVMTAFRERWNRASAAWLADDPFWVRLTVRWIGNDAHRRALTAARLRKRRDSALADAAVWEELAGEIEGGSQ